MFSRVFPYVGKKVELIAIFFLIATLVNLHPLTLDTSCTIFAPVFPMWIISLPTLTFSSPNIISVSFVLVESYTFSSSWQN
jgi:hypothetical protein